ncbi:MAG: hypothetical protein H6713_01155 [Myxococcales bacterium]|nr:hypothetical protein [Myxococcales bacterium]
MALASGCASASEPARDDGRDDDPPAPRAPPATQDDGWRVTARLHETRARPSPTIVIDARRPHESPQSCLALELAPGPTDARDEPRLAAPPGFRVLSATLGECARGYAPSIAGALAGAVEIDRDRCRLAVQLELPVELGGRLLDRRALPLRACTPAAADAPKARSS